MSKQILTLKPEMRTFALAFIFRNTHRDYKGGTVRDNNRAILMLIDGATTSVPLNSMTDAQIIKKLTNHFGEVVDGAEDFVRVITK